MKLRYYPETDTLYIDVSDRPSEDSVEVTDEVVLDLDAAGQVTGIDIQHASEIADLSSVAVWGLPVEIFGRTSPRTENDRAEAVSHGRAR